MSLVLTTPTGHIGSALVRRLLDAGRDDLLLLARDASRLDADVRARVEVREGTLQDAAFVEAATVGADAVFWLSPPDVTTPSLFGWDASLADALTGAVRANGIGHVVHLSSEGAQNREDHGPVSGLGRIEAALDATDAAVRHLRPTFFMENVEAQLGAVQEAGALFFPAPPATTTGMIATRDIAAVAADLLLDRSWTGRAVVPLHGPRDLSYADAASILSRVLGRTVEARQVPAEAVVQQFLGMGASDGWARGLATLYAQIGTPGYSTDERTEASTTPTTLETYAADTLRPLLDGSAVAAG